MATSGILSVLQGFPPIINASALYLWMTILQFNVEMKWKSQKKKSPTVTLSVAMPNTFPI